MTTKIEQGFVSGFGGVAVAGFLDVELQPKTVLQ
jgi:hypothetical protein